MAMFRQTTIGHQGKRRLKGRERQELHIHTLRSRTRVVTLKRARGGGCPQTEGGGGVQIESLIDEPSKGEIRSPNGGAQKWGTHCELKNPTSERLVIHASKENGGSCTLNVKKLSFERNKKGRPSRPSGADKMRLCSISHRGDFYILHSGETRGNSNKMIGEKDSGVRGAGHCYWRIKERLGQDGILRRR